MGKMPLEKYLDSVEYEIAYATKILKGEIGAGVDIDYALSRLKEARKMLAVATAFLENEEA